MNLVLQPSLRKFVVVFLDDILIFSKTWEEHQHHTETVLETLRKNKLYCKASKCEFGMQDVLSLGHRINGTCISPDPVKLQAVSNWKTPSSVSEVRQFLGFANYFRRFIRQYSDISASLEEITGNNSRIQWSDAREKAFQSLRAALLRAPVFHIADVRKSFRVESDASDFALGAVLVQEDNEVAAWHAIAYCNRNLTQAERYYTAAERETLAVVFALRSWRIYLFQHFSLFTDSMVEVYLRIKPNLTKRETRWAEFLADCNFPVYHKCGKDSVADALSRRPDLQELDSDSSCANMDTKPQINAFEFALELCADIADIISESYPQDKELLPITQKLNDKPNDGLRDRYHIDKHSGHLYLKATPNNRLCIPKCKVHLQLIQEYHGCVTAGHPGKDRTYFVLDSSSIGREWALM